MKLLYFAWIREHVGTSAEEISRPDDVKTVSDLIAWLAGRGDGYATAFADTALVRAAVNQEHVDPLHPVADGDEIAFFPPVTGG
ncbi:MAG: molybdopterin converting factor subunit 1 [Rhodospirillales bacterium]|nr:molybdopterin converting factor subunit 1 [Rhodospirillales bacterium]